MQVLGLIDWEAAGRGIAAFLCKFIYQLIAWMYELFITIARVNILSSEDIAPIYQRITMILTIVMVFYITFEFVKYVVQPDTINDKEKGVGNIALKIIVVILLIAFVPKIFTIAYDLQGRIIDNQFFSKIILGKKEVDMSTYGRGFSADMFHVFYKVNEEACKVCDSEGVVNFNLNRLREKGDLRYLTAGLNESASVWNPATQKHEDTPTIDFDGLFAIVVGVVLIYILALYCIDVGTRYAQLIFLQIISPIAIMGYLSPKKDNMFSKWIKQCITTYINLFVRIALIYFVLLICQVLGESFTSGKLFEGLGDISPSIQAFTYIALIMGLLLFANKAPKMLQELFPSSGAAGIGFGLGAKERGLDRLAGAAIGTATGAVAGAASGLRQGMRGFKSGGKLGKRIASGLGNGLLGATGGLIGGTARGFAGGVKKGNPLKNGLTGARNQMKANKTFGNKVENDYNILHQAQDKFGIHSRQETAETQKATIQRHKDVLDKVKKANDDMRTRAEKKIREDGKGGEAGQEFLEKEKVARDFKENPNIKAQYTVSKYQTEDQAYDAYIDAVKDARASVNRQNFISADGTLNRSAYESACDRAASKVNQADFKVGYATQEEADRAFAEDYQKAIKEAKEAKDKAIDYYINNENDSAIDSMKITMETEIKEYNKYNQDRQVDINKIPTEAHDFDEYTKKELKAMQDIDERDIIEQNAKIEAIKREVAGSKDKSQ